MHKPYILVAGAGKGVGNHTARAFAAQGMSVVLLARRSAALQEYRQEFAAAGIECAVYQADCADAQGFASAVEQVLKEHGAPAVALYNSANLSPEDKATFDAVEMARRYTADTASCYTLARALEQQADFRAQHGALLMTGGAATYLDAPFYGALSLCLDKAALRFLAMILNEHWHKEGMYAGVLTPAAPVYLTEDSGFGPQRMAAAFVQMNTERKAAEYILTAQEAVPCSKGN